MGSGIVIIGYITQPGIVDVRYVAQNIKRKDARGLIVFRNPPTYNVNIRALHGNVELIQAENIRDRVRKLNRRFKAEGYNVVIKDLSEVRDGMRDPM